MAFKPGKDHYICDRCGLEVEAEGGHGQSYKPIDWKCVDVIVCHDGEHMRSKSYDACPDCAELYMAMAYEMGKKYLGEEN